MQATPSAKAPSTTGRRFAEASLAAMALLLGLPLLVLLAAGVTLSDPGPVFFAAERIGLNGVPFRIYKFRTMRQAFQGGGSRIAASRDPRVFPFGAVLRRLKLDELPQLLNILRGDMAFVGPRPEDPWFVEHVYSAADRATLRVRPGLTSPGTLYYFTHAEQFLDAGGAEAAYISGPLQTKLRLDLEYIARATLASDLRLVFQTLRLLLRRRASYIQ